MALRAIPALNFTAGGLPTHQVDQDVLSQVDQDVLSLDSSQLSQVDQDMSSPDSPQSGTEDCVNQQEKLFYLSDVRAGKRAWVNPDDTIYRIKQVMSREQNARKAKVHAEVDRLVDRLKMNERLTKEKELLAQSELERLQVQEEELSDLLRMTTQIYKINDRCYQILSMIPCIRNERKLLNYKAVITDAQENSLKRQVFKEEVIKQDFLSKFAMMKRIFEAEQQSLAKLHNDWQSHFQNEYNQSVNFLYNASDQVKQIKKDLSEVTKRVNEARRQVNRCTESRQRASTELNRFLEKGQL